MSSKTINPETGRDIQQGQSAQGHSVSASHIQSGPTSATEAYTISANTIDSGYADKIEEEREKEQELQR
jgi:hypothetical protein